MALPAENDVGRLYRLQAIERGDMIRFNEDFQADVQAVERRLQLKRAGTLAINCVVDKIDEQSISSSKASR